MLVLYLVLGIMAEDEDEQPEATELVSLKLVGELFMPALRVLLP